MSYEAKQRAEVEAEVREIAANLENGNRDDVRATLKQLPPARACLVVALVMLRFGKERESFVRLLEVDGL